MFWQTREFYYPGSFKYNHDGFKGQEIRPILEEMDISLNQLDKTSPFLTYRSEPWLTADFLVHSPNIIDHLPDTTMGKSIILKTSSAWVYYEDETTVKIIFTKSIEDMQKSNGFFDYPGHDKEYLKDKYWLSISEVSL